MPSVKVAKTAVESGKQPSSMLSGKTVMFDLQGAALVENDNTQGAAHGGVLGFRGGEQSAATVHHGGKAPVSSEAGEWVANPRQQC